MENIKKAYLNYLQENIKVVKKSSEYKTKIVTPFVNSYGEGIYFYVEFDGSKMYTVTDEGLTLWNLEIEGIKLTKSGNRKNLFQSLLKYNGLQLNRNNEIYKTVTKSLLGQAIHDMTQLLLNVYDLSLLSPKMVHTQFLEDVTKYFFDNNKKYKVFADFSITGKSRINHRFNFLFFSEGKSKLTRVHNKIDKQQVDSIMASWLDTVEERMSGYGNKEELYIILSDEGYKNINDSNLTALNQYGINILNFSDKKQLEETLKA